jgi:hypothetical protein
VHDSDTSAVTDPLPPPRSTTGPAEAGDSGTAAGEAEDTGEDRRLAWATYALAVLPFAVAAVAVLAGVGGDYLPAGDLAMTEMHIRDIGRHEVLVGLFSRLTWSHPGPLQFYLVAPFYWLTGGSSAGMVAGALALNGATAAGMVAVARRRGGTPAALSTVVATGLLVRTLGTEFLGDSWNLTLTVLPLALLVLLTWSLLAGDVVLLPVAAVVTTFLVQTHAGFVLIAAPLLALGAGAAAVRALRGRGATGAEAGHGNGAEPERGDGAEPAGGAGTDRRRVARLALISAAVLVVLWLPPLIEAIRHSPSNLGNLVRYFRDPGEPANSLADGLRVVTAQFGPDPEWLTGKLAAHPLTGESIFVSDAPVPVLLVVLAAAGAVLWRRTGESRALVLAVGAVLVTCVASVMRTAGPVFDYRLRYTWAPPAVAAIAVLWAGWLVVARRWPRLEARALVPGFLVAGALLTAVNAVDGATAGVPHAADTEIVAALTDPVVEAYAGAEEPVVVYEPPSPAVPWYSRGLVLQLERRGVEVEVDRRLGSWFTEARTHTGGPVADRLVVAVGDDIPPLMDDPDLRLLAEWSSVPAATRDRIESEHADLADARAAGDVTDAGYVRRFIELQLQLQAHPGITADHVALFVDDRPVAAAPG